MSNKNWIKETARDIISLGSIVFYLLVIGRALVGPFWIFLVFLCTAAVILLFIYLFYKEFELYLARGLILAIGTAYFYNDIIYAIFASVIYFLMIFSSSFLGNSSLKIIKGIVIGLLSTMGGYLTAEFLFEKPWY